MPRQVEAERLELRAQRFRTGKGRGVIDAVACSSGLAVRGDARARCDGTAEQVALPGLAIGAYPAAPYYAPPPVYSYPAPVYYEAPPPVYYRPPPPVYYRPAPIIAPAPGRIYYGPGYPYRAPNDWDDERD